MRDFRKLDVWRKGHKLALRIYQVTKVFPKEELYGLTSQMRRAGVSVPSNIAEGCGHRSESEFGRYLQLANASASELQYLSILAGDLGYLEDEAISELSDSIAELKKMLSSLMKHVRSRIAE